ncbi:hypothetical protein EVAR_72849_1 [Eumeta japonica]|uniref:Uncharacterized protein n=1 Tax=Eumeta variegata TaxID=151549 RepID=A0A4C1TA25_EUMVA|nr:hypothetical protein EVAR_72849_1 [Eumeta japonica]
MSSVYVAYKLGDKKLPYGTPVRIRRGADDTLLTATHKLRWWRKLAMTLVSASDSGVSGGVEYTVITRFMATNALLERCLSAAVDIPSSPGAFFLGRRSTILCSSAGDINRFPGWGGGVSMNLLTLSSAWS